MKHRWIVTTCFGLLLGFSGCGEREIGAGTYPPTDGDFVRNLNGRGTAKVWGISFEVADPVGHASTSKFEGGLHSDPEKTDARFRFALGDEVEIQLEKVPGSPITFKLNGKLYGALETGDKVIVDKQRNVKVNDTARKPEGAGL